MTDDRQFFMRHEQKPCKHLILVKANRQFSFFSHEPVIAFCTKGCAGWPKDEMCINSPKYGQCTGNRYTTACYEERP